MLSIDRDMTTRTMKHNRVRIFVGETGDFMLVDVHGNEIVTTKLSVSESVVTAEIPDVKIERGPTHYIRRNSSGSIFVEEAEIFQAQGGLSQEWGESWTPVTAGSIDEAIRIGEGLV